MHHLIIHIAQQLPTIPTPKNAQPTTWFWSTSIGAIVWSLMGAIGIIIVLMTATKALKDFSGGKMGPGMQKVVIGLVLAAYCFYPPLINDTINIFVGVVQAVINSISGLVSGSGGGGGVTTTT